MTNEEKYDTNGNGTVRDREKVRKKLADFLEEDVDPRVDRPAPETDEPGEPDEQTEGVSKRHTVKRHPEDPPDGLKIAVSESSLLDPDALRVNAVDGGIAMQAVEPEVAFAQADNEYNGLYGVRKGAVTGPALEEAGKLLERELATKREVEALAAEGEAAAEDADRFEEDNLPRLEKEVEETTEAHVDAVVERDEFEDDARKDPAHWDELVKEDPNPEGGPLHWLSLAKSRAALVFVVELVLGALILSSPVAETFIIDIPAGSLLIATGLSACFVVLGFALGRVLHATRIPVRLVAFLFVAAAVFILAKSVGALDALREGELDKAKTILTAATLTSVYVACLTSYAGSVFGLFQRRRELIQTIPTATDLWQVDWKRLNDQVVETKTKMEQAVAELKAGLDHIDERRAFAAGADQRCREREAAGIAAGVKYETVKAVTNVHVDQERSNRDAAIEAFKMAHAKTRAEVYPKVSELRTAANVEEDARKGLGVLVKAAIAALVIGAIGGLLELQIVLTLGAAVAAILLLLSLSNWTPRFGKKKQAAKTPPLKVPDPVTTLPGAEEAPGWKVPPRTTKPKYSTAPNDPTQHH